jgi:hypothetical protein
MMRSRSEFSRLKSRRGMVAVFVAICLTVILSAAALALDAGLLIAERRHAQATADAAAMSAAYSLWENFPTNQGTDPSLTATTAAYLTTTNNGFPTYAPAAANKGTGSGEEMNFNPFLFIQLPKGPQQVFVNIPPKTGTFAGQAGYAQVVVGREVPRYFSSIWGSGTIGVSATAVARAVNRNGIVVSPLAPSAAPISGSSNTSFNIPNGSVTVYSPNSGAASPSPGPTITAKAISVSGTIPSGQLSPAATLPAPSSSSLSLVSTSKVSYSSGSQTLSPGIYQAGISLSGNVSATFSPGIYYVSAGGISITTSGTVTGSGVMIYNASTSSSDKISITGTGKLTLSPPTSGLYAGVSLFQNASSTAPVTLTGNGNLTISGAVYAADAALNLNVNSTTDVYGAQFVVGSMVTSGSGTVNVGTVASSGIRDTRLVQ